MFSHLAFFPQSEELTSVTVSADLFLLLPLLLRRSPSLRRLSLRWSPFLLLSLPLLPLLLEAEEEAREEACEW